MKIHLKNIVLLLSALLLAGCFRNDIRTAVFHVEQLRSQEAAGLLAQSLKGLPGITEIHPDLGEKTFTVVFNGRELYLKNIEYAIVKSGFDLPNWPAEPSDKMKLPEEIR